MSAPILRREGSRKLGLMVRFVTVAVEELEPVGGVWLKLLPAPRAPLPRGGHGFAPEFAFINRSMTPYLGSQTDSFNRSSFFAKVVGTLIVLIRAFASGTTE